MILIAPKVPCRGGPKLLKVRGLEDMVLDGVPLVDRGGRRVIPMDEITGNICGDLVARLTTRFDMRDELIAATAIANKKTWPSTLEEAKGIMMTIINLSWHICHNLQ